MNNKNKRFLIALLRFHGDIVLTIPMISEIKRNFPNAVIDFLVYEGTGAILHDDPRINNILEANYSSKSNFLMRIVKEIKLLRELKSSNYDYGVFLTTQWRMALIARCLGKAKTAGVDDTKRKKSGWVDSFSAIFPEAGKKHIIERNLSSLEALDLEVNFNRIESKIFISKNTVDSVKELIKDYSIGKKYCVLHPVSRREVKQWKKEYFVEVIDYFSNKGFKVVMSSGPEISEITYLNEIESMCKTKLINLGGKTSLIQLAELIKNAHFFIALDSVASHLGAAVGARGLALFGPSKVENWRPWSEDISVISRSNKEELCSLHGHLEGKRRQCLCYISSQRVINEIGKLIN
tara:strand:- start:6707 stop:7756 length:1050 start_codon:yes stop_codon:yes gene_type:complete